MEPKMCLSWGSCPHILYKSINQFENETHYFQYAVGEIDKVPTTYCKTIV